MTALDQDALLDEARRRLGSGQDLQDVPRFLRASGCSMTDSIKATMRLTGASLAQAKRTVHTSEAWSDLRGAHDEFHRALEESLEINRSERP